MCFPIPGGAPPLACCSHNFLNWQSKASELRFSGSSCVFCFQGGKKSARVQEKGARKEGPEGWRQEVWSILWWEPDTSRFSFSRRKSNRFFDDLRKGFPVYLDPKNQNTFVFSRDSGGPSRSSVCLKPRVGSTFSGKAPPQTRCVK